MITNFIRGVRGSALVRNSVVLFTGTMLANLINYIFHFVMGRMVEPSVYGEMESIVSLLTIVSVPGAAITLVAARFAASAKAGGSPAASRAVFSYLNRKLLRYGIPALIVALFLTPYVARFLRIDQPIAIVFLWGMMFLSFFTAAATGILQGWQRFFSVGSIQAIGSIVKLLFSVFFVWIGFQVDGIIGAFFLAGIASYILARFLIRRIDASYEAYERSERDDAGQIDLASVRPYAVPALFGALSIAILGNADMILAKYHLPPDTAGLYGALFIVAKTIFFAGGILSSVLFSMSAEEHDRNGGMKKDSKLFRHALSLSVLFVIGSVGFFALFPEFVLKIFFGSRYLEGASLLGLFALGSGIYVIVNFFQQYLLSIHRTRVVWGMLAVSIIGTLVMFFFGKSMESLVWYVVYTQAASLVVGLFHYLTEVGYNKSVASSE